MEDGGAAQVPLLLTESRQQRDTFWPCVANLSKVIIGAGMMAIPQAYCRIGSLTGTAMLVLVGLMTYSTLVFLLKGSAATGATTYAQLTRVLCGAAVMKVLQLAVLSFCFGFGVVYLVIIRDILLGTPPVCNGLLCELLGLSPTSVLSDARLVILGVALLFCCPLLLLRTMDRLAVLNVVGVGAIGMLALTALCLAIKGCILGTAHATPVWPQWQQLGDTPAQQLQALAAVMPVMIACYVAHQSLHPLIPLLQPYSDARMRGVIAAALLIAFGVFTSLAVGSSLVFGPALEVNVLNNFSVTGLEPLAGPLLARVLSWAIRGGYLLSLLASLLLYMHPLRACLAEMVWPDKQDAAADSRQVGSTTGQHTQAPLTEEASALTGPRSHLHDYGSLPAARFQGSSASHNPTKADAAARLSEPGAQRDASAGSSPNQRGSAFAQPTVQAAAAAAAAAAGGGGGGRHRAGDSSGASSTELPAASSSQNRQLSTFDSLDNPRTGSWSGIRYMSNGQARPEPAGAAQQLCSKGRADSSSTSVSLAAPGQQQGPEVRGLLQSEGPQHPWVRIIVTDAGDSAVTVQSVAPAAGHNWQQAEQQWYYWLTYGLLVAMVIVAIVVPNIWTALSAIGDLASTLQAFVVPGLLGIVLAARSVKLTHLSSVRARLQRWGNVSTGGLAVFLGLALFANGIFQRL